MRFKKLRFMLAVSLMIFIFVVANTIGFGLLHEQTVSPVDNGGKELKITKENITKTENTSSTTGIGTTQQPPATTTTVVKQTRRTRAS